jgi:hypothetical protein
MKSVKLAVAAAAMVAAISTSAYAQDSFELQPFVVEEEECDVVSEWVADEGVDGGFALYLKKGCTTATFAAAGVDIITELEGGDVSELTELDFSVRGHCGAGAPRFNVVVDGSTYFLGCSGGDQTDLGDGWTHVVFDADEFAAAGIPVTGTLEDIYIIFDEGTDTPAGGGIVTPGEAYLDDISVNGEVVGDPASPTDKNQCKNGGWRNFINPPFKNQGQCVSYVVSNRGGNR